MRGRRIFKNDGGNEWQSISETIELFAYLQADDLSENYAGVAILDSG